MSVIGETEGRYRLGKLLGEGGMGQVGRNPFHIGDEEVGALKELRDEMISKMEKSVDRSPNPDSG